MRTTQDFCDGWTCEGQPVRLPHNALDLPLNYFDEAAYQRPFVYEKRFAANPAWEGREVRLRFEGAMANAVVSLNGTEVARHSDGYTPFDVRLTGRLAEGENVLSVVVDGTENPGIPPFGGKIDYLTYAGIYREVGAIATSPVSIGLHKIETPDVLSDARGLTARIELDNPQGLDLTGRLTATLLDAGGHEVATTEAEAAPVVEIAMERLDVRLWDVDDPALYTLRLDLETSHGADRVETRIGFRHAEFTSEGFRLNGRPLKIRGLNRHQSFPYVGYAMGRAAQERDADILKHELRLNLARTSHYPQSTWFLDRCDEIGLLVFEEFPGWQHIGGAEWKARAVDNLRAMLRRDWNHPSIILWGVRINESPDDHDFYAETNRVARALDPTRQTGGVRCHAESEFLEDVYTMNDFVLGEFEVPEIAGNRPRTPLRPQREVTGLDREVPYLVTEFNGHMFPTKITDPEPRQAEHVIRHLEVLDAAYGDPSISGCIGWCAFDYNTHKDFGAGDRICHHGVMDMFREPKFAAYAYASQAEPDGGVVLQPVTYWTRGERNIQGVLPLIVLTNCDEVEIQYGDFSAVRLTPDRARFPNLPHPPVIAQIADFVGKGLDGWGSAWRRGRVTGLIGGKPVATRHYVPDPVPTRLEVAPDRNRIAVHDEVRVMVRLLDQAGNKLPNIADPVAIEVEGARLLGPSLVPLRAGATGFWLHAGQPGEVTVRVTSGRLDPVTAKIEVA